MTSSPTGSTAERCAWNGQRLCKRTKRCPSSCSSHTFRSQLEKAVEPSFCKPIHESVATFRVLFQTWMCLENPIADLILYYWFLHLFTQSVELRSFWVNHLSIGSLRIRWLPKSPCNPRHSMCPLFRSFGINWPEPLLRAQLAAPNVRHPNVNGVGNGIQSS